MNHNPPEENFRLAPIARSLPYPPTPDLARLVTRRLHRRPAPLARRRLVLAAALLLACLALLLSAPAVRAQLVEWIQIGVVRIFPPSVTPTPQAPAAQPALQSTPSPDLLISLAELGGETTLEDARRQVDFSVRLPTYPPGLGAPDRVFLMHMGKPFLVLVWLDPQRTSEIAMSLHIFPSGSVAAEKWSPRTISETTVNGQYAAWVTGPYLLLLRSGDFDFRRLVNGSVLVWEADGLTYRIETQLSMDEAVKIAESLK